MADDSMMCYFILSHHYFCTKITSKCIQTLCPLTTQLQIDPNHTITLRNALSMLYQPYEIGYPPHTPPAPVILDSSQNPDNLTYITAYCF